MTCRATTISGVLLVASVGCSNAAPVSTGAGQTQQPLALELDCQPRVSEIPRFEGTCQYVGADVPIMTCQRAEQLAVGSLTMKVLRPEAVVVGQRTPVGGATPVVSVEAAATAGDLLVQSTSAGGVGFVVFDQFQPGKVMSGSFVETSIEMQPDPAFPCRLSSGHFGASSGPGVTSP